MKHCAVKLNASTSKIGSLFLRGCLDTAALPVTHRAGMENWNTGRHRGLMRPVHKYSNMSQFQCDQRVATYTFPFPKRWHTRLIFLSGNGSIIRVTSLVAGVTKTYSDSKVFLTIYFITLLLKNVTRTYTHLQSNTYSDSFRLILMPILRCYLKLDHHVEEVLQLHKKQHISI